MGSKSYEALEADWLSHFKARSFPRGRPEGKGWWTILEMADKAGCGYGVMKRYIDANINDYEVSKGSFMSSSGWRPCRYFRFNKREKKSLKT